MGIRFAKMRRRVERQPEPAHGYPSCTPGIRSFAISADDDTIRLVPAWPRIPVDETAIMQGLHRDTASGPGKMPDPGLEPLRRDHHP